MQSLVEKQNPLIKLHEQEDGSVVVLGRDLHEFLEITERYNSWFERMLQYGFSNEVDYTSVKSFTLVNNGAQRKIDNHVMTIDMAKEVSMIQRNDKGKQARQYFIRIERAWNSPEMIMKRALEFADMRVKELENKFEEAKPRIAFSQAVEASKQSILIGELSKLIKQNGVDIGQNRLFEWLRENGFLIKQNGENYNLPTQKSMNLELMDIKKRTINNADGSVRVTRTTKITGKGQVYFVNKFINEVK
ncbi:MAG: phage antirepressor KilAC domain-containing protein [Carnobacterium sp.]